MKSTDEYLSRLKHSNFEDKQNTLSDIVVEFEQIFCTIRPGEEQKQGIIFDGIDLILETLVIVAVDSRIRPNIIAALSKVNQERCIKYLLEIFKKYGTVFQQKDYEQFLYALYSFTKRFSSESKILLKNGDVEKLFKECKNIKDENLCSVLDQLKNELLV
jgi:hypothetical protein